MSSPLLVTKLYVPRPRAGAIARPRLVARLDEGLRGGLTVISAPAGFGKTTLVSEWVAHAERDIAWLSLDEGDGDPGRFLAYLGAALQTARPGLDTSIARGQQTSRPPPVEQALTMLLNEIAASPDPLLLVLDDYHLVDSAAVDEALTFFLDHLPANLHLAITTREDPRLPLPRLRARGRLTELRAADLRFTVDEAAAFLNDAMGLDLSPSDVAALETRIEGWIAGLQLAALSMQGRDDVTGFIQRFASGNRYIVDYLVEEVLERQPEPIREFLLQTSILDRLNGSLCDAVTGRDDSRKLLDRLDRGNLFIMPLDDGREWSRYHHLFAEVLRSYAMDDAGLSSRLHRRASEWFERHGPLEDAIRHAFAAGDHARAADLVETAAPGMQRARLEPSLLAWLRMLPDDFVRARPVLSNLFAGALLSTGELEGVEFHLRNVERWLNLAGGDGERGDSLPEGMVVVDRAGYQRLPAGVAIYRAAFSLATGDLDAAVRDARRALDLVQEDDYLSIGAASALLGLVFWSGGDLDPAYEHFAGGMAALGKAGNIVDTVGGVLALADIRITQGRLRDAMTIYRDALRVAEAHGPPVVRGTADLHVGMSEIHRERNDLYAARQCLVTGIDLGETVGFPQHPYRWRLASARQREVEGDLDGALDLIDEAERRYVSDFYPNVRPVAAHGARVWIAQGRLDDAQRWAAERGLSAGDDVSYPREFEHIVLARLMIAQYRAGRDMTVLDDAIGLLDRLRDAAEADGRSGNMIEILVLSAMARSERGDVSSSVDSLERALSLSEPEGYARVFIDEGPSMATLLAGVAARGTANEYAARLLAAFDGDAAPVAASVSSPAAPPNQPLVEPLSERELEVLRLIAEGRSNSEIADRLYLALSTVKGHNRAILGKLGVQRRTGAVARATELGLL